MNMSTGTAMAMKTEMMNAGTTVARSTEAITGTMNAKSVTTAAVGVTALERRLVYIVSTMSVSSFTVSMKGNTQSVVFVKLQSFDSQARAFNRFKWFSQ
jgi:hypothetical protein